MGCFFCFAKFLTCFWLLVGEENMEALDDDDEEENRGNEKKDSSFSFILNVNDAKASSFLTFSTLMQLSFMVTTC